MRMAKCYFLKSQATRFRINSQVAGSIKGRRGCASDHTYVGLHRNRRAARLRISQCDRCIFAPARGYSTRGARIDVMMALSCLSFARD